MDIHACPKWGLIQRDRVMQLVKQVLHLQVSKDGYPKFSPLKFFDLLHSCNIYYSLYNDTLSITHPSSTAILIHFISLCEVTHLRTASSSPLKVCHDLSWPIGPAYLNLRS